MRNSIDYRVEQLTSSLSVTLTIDEVNGSDAAAGTDAAPLKTLKEALARTPSGGVATIFLKSSITLSEALTTRARSIALLPAAGVTASLRVGWYADPAGLWRPGKINIYGVHCGISLNGVGLQFLARATGARADAYAAGVIQTNSLTPPPFIGLYDCMITRDAGADAFLIASSTNSAVLHVATSTCPTSMAGFWCAGVAAGAAVSSTRYNTDLSTL